jgi:hypothetical protein
MSVKKNFIQTVIHVDDYSVFHNNKALCTKVFTELSTHYTLKRGPLNHFLGMRVVRDSVSNLFTLDQEEYAVSVLKRFGMYDCKTVVCPETQHKLSKNQCPPNAQEETEMRDMPYSELVGCIQYLVVCTRPDLAHSASQVSRFMQNPGKSHWAAALRVLKYLRGTLSHKLHFSKSPLLADLVGFSDADHAGCPDTRRSHSGYICKVNDTAVAWASRRQRCVALSSCESEYIAICECAKQIVWLRRLLIDLGHSQDHETPIYCDNQAAKSLTENPIHHDRTKHIDMQYHYTRDLVDEGFVVVRYIPAIDEQADILTKEYIGK